MHTGDGPFLIADANGVWREDTPGRRFGITWDEIYCISAHKLDYITHVVTVVTLDWDFGEYFELMDNWLGFDEVARAISSRIPRIDPCWIDRIHALTPRAPGIQVWKRA